jgi:4-alpha-glucanotransferase
MLNILALEAARAGAFVVGEDLGTVEDEVRRDLHERQVLSYKVWWFEADNPASWPERALGTVSTHDLPTVAGVVSGSDLRSLRSIGLQPNEQASGLLRMKLLERAGRHDDLTVEEAIRVVHEDLSRAPCLLLAASLEDVLAVEERPNMPGTVDEWPNWSLALPASLEQIEQAPLASAIADSLSRGARRDGPERERTEPGDTVL